MSRRPLALQMERLRGESPGGRGQAAPPPGEGGDGDAAEASPGPTSIALALELEAVAHAASPEQDSQHPADVTMSGLFRWCMVKRSRHMRIQHDGMIGHGFCRDGLLCSKRRFNYLPLEDSILGMAAALPMPATRD